MLFLLFSLLRSFLGIFHKKFTFPCESIYLGLEVEATPEKNGQMNETCDQLSSAYLSNIRFILASVNLTKCQEERIDALNKLSQDPPLLGVFVPNCKPDGQYEDKQCHELYCWCVGENGERIPGTTVRGSSMVCYPRGKMCLSPD